MLKDEVELSGYFSAKIKEILKKNLQKFHSLFCKALGLLQGSFPSMLAPRFVSAATSLIR